MKTEWRTVPLGKIVKCEGGTGFPHRYQGRRNGDYAFFKVSDMNAAANSWKMTQAANYVSERDLSELRTKPKPRDSVVFPKVGGALLTNKKRMLAAPAAIDNNLMAVWPLSHTDCLPDFLYFYFLATDLAELANPGPLPSINASRVYECEIHLPLPVEQKKIATVLWKIQKAVEIEDAIVRNARDLKKSLLRRLFTHGLRGEPLKETEIGPLPQSWDVQVLSECAHVQTGVAKGRPIDPSKLIEVPYLRVANVQHGHLDLSEIKKIQIRRDELNRYSLRKDDVVVTEGGDFDKLGRGFIWDGQVDPCVHQNHIFAIRPHRDRLLPQYLAYLIQSPHGRGYFLTVAHKTTNLACINTSKLKALPVLLPPLSDQENIAGVLQTVDHKIDIHESKKRSLQDLFKTSLNKLMTAQIRVNDLEIDTSEVETPTN